MVQDLLLQGLIALVPESERFLVFSNLFTVLQESVRPILDLKALNLFFFFFLLNTVDL